MWRGIRFLLLFICAVGARPSWAGFSGTDLFLPAVGRVSGSGGSEFYTTLWVTNPSTTQPATATLRFLRSGGPNFAPASATYTLTPGETRLFENVTETVFASPGVLGALRVQSSADVLVAARIYNQSAGAPLRNTQGLFFGGVPASLALRPGDSTVIQGVSQNEDFRYNFFAVETTGQTATLRMKILDANGAIIAQKDYGLGAFQQLLAGVTDIQPGFTTSNATLEASVVGGSGRVIVAGSQTANQSQDGSGFEMAFGPITTTANPFTLNGLSGNVTLAAGPNISITPSGNTLTISASAGGGTITGITATGGLTGGGTTGNVTVGIADGGITSDKIAPGQLVKSINGLKDGVTLAAGSNISINPSGTTLTISSSAGSGPPSGAAGGVLAGSYPNPDFANGQVVRYIKVGGTTASLTDEVQLAPGENISLGVSGSSVIVSSAGVTTDGLTLAGNGTGASPLGLAIPLTLNASCCSFGLLMTGGNSPDGSLQVFAAGAGAAIGGVSPGLASRGFLGDGPSNSGVYGSGSIDSYAGYFDGKVMVNGTLSKSAGSFRIDHPLDPENKYLYHSFVESPDMMNVYNGNVLLDGRGEATVDLPDWFSALNRDYRYQLTAMGAPGPDLFVAEEITANRFRIAGGAPGGKVSWQVTGVRRDPYAEAHRIPVEEIKPEAQRGSYVHPELYGLPQERGLTPRRPIDDRR